MRARRGQSLTEIAILVALVAIASIGLIGFYGDNIRHLFNGSASNLAGDCSTGATPRGKYLETKNLSSFGLNASSGRTTMRSLCP